MLETGTDNIVGCQLGGRCADRPSKVTAQCGVRKPAAYRRPEIQFSTRITAPSAVAVNS
jgi:hypothetical protein